MPSRPTVTEDDLAHVLREDPARALALVHEQFGLLLVRYLKRWSWGLLSVEDLQDAYQETLCAFWQQARRSEFEPDRALRLVQAIARRKAIDALRRRGHAGSMQMPEPRPELEADLRGSRLGVAWRERMRPAERQELREVLLDIVAELPERQRLVARVFLDHFEEFNPRDTYPPLTVALSRLTGQAENVLAVKSLWRAARAKIAEQLTRRGYALD
jgi:DNA-directed RNA polymerase specialized sigma24 family protein